MTFTSWMTIIWPTRTRYIRRKLVWFVDRQALARQACALGRGTRRGQGGEAVGALRGPPRVDLESGGFTDSACGQSCPPDSMPALARRAALRQHSQKSNPATTHGESVESSGVRYLLLCKARASRLAPVAVRSLRYGVFAKTPARHADEGDRRGFKFSAGRGREGRGRSYSRTNVGGAPRSLSSPRAAR